MSVRTIKFCESLRKDSNVWSIGDQLLRSTTSIGANVIEAKAASSKRDYVKFFEIALKSANETKYWLMVIIGSINNDGTTSKAKESLKEADEISKVIGSSVLTLKGKKRF